jgi:glycine cleavage system protein P-like pyridoxal-binding family
LKNLAAVMITFPSTHGVFENIRDIPTSFTAMADRSISTAPT